MEKGSGTLEKLFLNLCPMPKTESRIGIIRETEEKIFLFLSDFRNFRSLLPADRVKDFEPEDDRCSFRIEGIGKVGLKIIEKVPFKLIKIGSDENTPFDFLLWIQVKEVEKGDSRMKITTEVNINPVMASMVKKPLKTFVDSLVDQAEKISYDPV